MFQSPFTPISHNLYRVALSAWSLSKYLSSACKQMHICTSVTHVRQPNAPANDSAGPSGGILVGRTPTASRNMRRTVRGPPVRSIHKRGTSLIRQRPTPQDFHKALGVGLL